MRTRWFLLFPAGLAASLATVGCARHGDPHYNPYAPEFERRPIATSLDGMMNSAGEALDNLDGRAENWLY